MRGARRLRHLPKAYLVGVVTCQNRRQNRRRNNDHNKSQPKHRQLVVDEFSDIFAQEARRLFFVRLFQAYRLFTHKLAASLLFTYPA